ncbi:uracil-DNA glycosylase family protein [Lactobacillus acidophilus]|uniref:uracil-DNA glycosylase family protein n=1 Tax=Lactobacillus acidophilus TaxID=1579 RepID=UPI0021A5FBA2|nr:uracil-DNA glycosylase family protein [Lactobacillus acidophilus]MCT3602536.1 uracil-DNA glycosylase family protein [Lactobacillus acidophilus]MCT3623538.1 uracil-DNA glycosylase family protein [Lactobacillus acidophilus]
MQSEFQKIFQEIQADPDNKSFTKQGIKPLYYASSSARINIIGQAPGRIAQEKMKFWDDPSGDRLRTWLGVSRDVFYNSGMIAILPMDFYYPGKGKSGDLPPRKGFAQNWHPQLLKLMPDIQLTILVGAYATRSYLHLGYKDRLTDIVRNYQQYLPDYFPIVHPSPRNKIWEAKNPWFEEQVIPDLQRRIQIILNN